MAEKERRLQGGKDRRGRLTSPGGSVSPTLRPVWPDPSMKLRLERQAHDLDKLEDAMNAEQVKSAVWRVLFPGASRHDVEKVVDQIFAKGTLSIEEFERFRQLMFNAEIGPGYFGRMAEEASIAPADLKSTIAEGKISAADFGRWTIAVLGSAERRTPRGI